MTNASAEAYPSANDAEDDSIDETPGTDVGAIVVEDRPQHRRGMRRALFTTDLPYASIVH